jgi:Spx/MgsR family transcriptional regulator
MGINFGMANEAKVFEYGGCSTCRKALKFLDARKVPYRKIAIVETPPSKTELKRMLIFLGGDIKRLFNTSGVEYRTRKMSEKLPRMSEEQAIAQLAGCGKLIKRPFVLTDEAGLVGFKEEEWKRVFK